MAEPPLKPILQKPPGYQSLAMAPQPGQRPPPRRNVLHSSFQPGKKRRSCCRICCCCFWMTLLILIILLLLGVSFFFLWFNPKLPTFHLESFRVTQFNVSAKQDGSSLTAQTVTRIEMRNPNGNLAIYYGDTDVDVSVGQGADKTGLGSAKVPEFNQDPKNTTNLKVQTQVTNQLINDAIAKRLAGDFKSKDLVVDVEVKTKVGLGAGGLKIGMLTVNLKCGGVSLKKLDSEMPGCTISTLRWIKIQ